MYLYTLQVSRNSHKSYCIISVQ